MQLAESQSQSKQLQSQFEELKSDFQYNLQLLAERDAELQQADTAAAATAAELATKTSTIAQLQAQLSHAQSGEHQQALLVSNTVTADSTRVPLLRGCAACKRTFILARHDRGYITDSFCITLLQNRDKFPADAKLERQRAADAATGFGLKLQELQQQLEQQRSSSSAALLKQKEESEQQRYSLQQLLAEAEEQLERQRRELSAGFLLQAQQLEAKHAAAVADARAEAATAESLADARAAEATAAHEQAAQQLTRAEVRLASCAAAADAALRTM